MSAITAMSRDDGNHLDTLLARTRDGNFSQV